MRTCDEYTCRERRDVRRRAVRAVQEHRSLTAPKLHDVFFNFLRETLTNTDDEDQLVFLVITIRNGGNGERVGLQTTECRQAQVDVLTSGPPEGDMTVDCEQKSVVGDEVNLARRLARLEQIIQDDPSTKSDEAIKRPEYKRRPDVESEAK